MSISRLRLLQLSDSGFPTGGYAYSHGLEFMYRRGLVTTASDVQQVMATHLDETLARVDLPLVTHGHRVASLDESMTIDSIAGALKPVPVFRDASQRTGRRFLDASLAAFQDLPATSAFRRAVGEDRTPGHHTVAFSVVTAESGIDIQPALESFALSSMQGYAAAAVRLSIVGQTTAQRLLALFSEDIGEAIERALEMPLDDLGGYSPMTDFAGLEHRTMNGRLFAS